MADGGTKIVVKGAQQLAATLQAAGRNLQRMTAANQRAGNVVATRAKVYCPVRTGRLQGSIHPVPSVSGFEVVASEGIIYGPVQHYGWPAHNIRATLFMTKGLESSRSDVMQIYQTEVANVMRGVRGA